MLRRVAGGAARRRTPAAAARRRRRDRQARLVRSAPSRTEASRTIRRAAAAVAVPALTRRPRRDQADGYVRYRALVLLAAFGDPRARDTMRAGRSTTATTGCAPSPTRGSSTIRDPAVVPTLVVGAGKRAVRVRASGAAPRAGRARRRSAAPRRRCCRWSCAARTIFRGAVIEALGDYQGRLRRPGHHRGRQARGPLQDDAVTALGKIGDKRRARPCWRAAAAAPREVAAVDCRARMCLLGINCAIARGLSRRRRWPSRATTTAIQPLLRGAARPGRLGDRAATRAR